MTINQIYLKSSELIRDLQDASHDYEKAAVHFRMKGQDSISEEYWDLSRQALRHSLTLEFDLQGVDIEI